MKLQTKGRRALRVAALLVTVVIVMILGIRYQPDQLFTVPIVIIFALAIGARALWAKANKHANGSEWWQDNDASGWRGY